MFDVGSRQGLRGEPVCVDESDIRITERRMLGLPNLVDSDASTCKKIMVANSRWRNGSAKTRAYQGSR